MSVAHPQTGSQARFCLADDERADFERLAAGLSGHGPRLVDDPAWLERARDVSAQLSLRLRQRLRRFAWDGGAEGMLLLSNLPLNGAELPDTPSFAGSVQRESILTASVLVLVAFQLGEPIAFREEKSGALVHDVVPVRGMESFQGNAGSVVLSAHVENAFHLHRPDFVGLFCLRNDHDNVAGLQIASIRRAMPLLPEAARETLFQPRFLTDAPASFGELAVPAAPHAVLCGNVSDPDVRVDFVATLPLDPEANDAMGQLRKAFAEVARTIILTPGDLAIVDNRLAVHGRTRFRARYDGRDRWLQRIFVQRDFRRSRGMRPDGGHVLTSTPAARPGE